MIIFQYIVLAFLVVYISLFLSKYIDALDKKTSLSGAFLGGIMLAAVTSLPELFTSITSVTLLDVPELVQGNVYGSNVLNLCIFSVCVLFRPKLYTNSTLSKSQFSTAYFTLFMYLACFLGMMFQVSLFNINFATVILFIMYFANLKLVHSEDTTENDNDSDLNLTVKQILIRFVLLSIVLVIISILLTKVTNNIAETYSLGATFAGAVFLGVATSLPEIVSSINLVRLGNFNAALGNIIGSNLFNLTILGFADILYRKGVIYIFDKSPLVLMFFTAVSTILVILTLFSKKSKVLSCLFSLLVLLSYSLSLYFAA